MAIRDVFMDVLYFIFSKNQDYNYLQYCKSNNQRNTWTCIAVRASAIA